MTGSDTSADLSPFCGWLEIFRSWFWRYYDQLGLLLVINLLWFLGCFSLGWTLQRVGLWGTWEDPKPLGLFAGFWLETLLSLPFAFLVSRIFNKREGFFQDYWKGLQKITLKALGISGLSAFFLAWGAFSVYFYFSFQGLPPLAHYGLAILTLWLWLFLLSAFLYQWPLLFSQNPPFFKIFFRSFLLVLGNGFLSLGSLIFLALLVGLFFLAPFLTYFLGLTFLFSFQCVALEKQLLRYKITFEDQPLESFLEFLQRERQRSWRELLKPWENR